MATRAPRKLCKTRYQLQLWNTNFDRICKDSRLSGESMALTINRIIDAHYTPAKVKPKDGWTQ